jgi:DNA-binding GntR family transcriptional regulator
MESDKDISERIKEHLLKKGYGPGKRIETENTLAEMFEVSRHSIRKVIDALTHQGIAVKYPRRGTSIEIWTQKQSAIIHLCPEVLHLRTNGRCRERLSISLGLPK